MNIHETFLVLSWLGLFLLYHIPAFFTVRLLPSFFPKDIAGRICWIFVTGQAIFFFISAPFLVAHCSYQIFKISIITAWLIWFLISGYFIVRKSKIKFRRKAVSNFEQATVCSSSNILAPIVANVSLWILWFICNWTISKNTSSYFKPVTMTVLISAFVFTVFLWRKRNKFSIFKENPQIGSQRLFGTNIENIILVSLAGIIIVYIVLGYLFARFNNTDDIWYIGMGLGMINSPHMNLLEPTLNEYPNAPTYIFLSWELFVSCISDISGLHPLAGFRTAAPILLVPLCFIACAYLAKLILPKTRRCILLCLIFFGIFCLSDNGEWTHLNMGKSILFTIWMGKYVMYMICLPILIASWVELYTKPDSRIPLRLLLVTLVGIGTGLLTTFFLFVIINSIMFISSAVLMGIKYKTNLKVFMVAISRYQLVAYIYSFVPLAALGFFTLYLYKEMGTKVVSTGKPTLSFLFNEYEGHLAWNVLRVMYGYRNLLILIFAGLPFVYLWGRRNSLLFPVVFIFMLFIICVSDLFYPYWVYVLQASTIRWRFTYIISEGFLLAIVFSVISEQILSFVERKSVRIKALVCLIILNSSLIVCTGGFSQFSFANFPFNKGRYSGAHKSWGEKYNNIYAIPDYICELKDRLTPDMLFAGRVLADEEIAGYIPMLFSGVHQINVQRRFTGIALTGQMSVPEGDHANKNELLNRFQLQDIIDGKVEVETPEALELFDRYHVTTVISRKNKKLLNRLGYNPVLSTAEVTVWQRKPDWSSL